MSPLCFSQLMMKMEEGEVCPPLLYSWLPQVMRSLFAHSPWRIWLVLHSNMLFDWPGQSQSLQKLCRQTVWRVLHPSRSRWRAPPLGWPPLQMTEMRYLWSRTKKKGKPLIVNSCYSFSWVGLFSPCMLCRCFLHLCE